MNATIEAPLNVGFRNRVTSNIAFFCTNCLIRKMINSRTPAANSDTIIVLPHPSALPRMIANTIRNSAPVNVTVPIQSTARASGLRDSLHLRQRQRHAHDPDRNVDIEDRRPAEVLGQEAAEQRADSGGGGDRRAPRPERRAPLLAVELLRQQRQRGREHDRPADALAGPGDDQEQRARRQRAQQRGEGEQHQPDREHQPAAEQVGQRARRQQHATRASARTRRSPTGCPRSSRSGRGDLRERDVHDRDVEQQHERRDADDDQRPPLTFHKSRMLPGPARPRSPVAAVRRGAPAHARP